MNKTIKEFITLSLISIVVISLLVWFFTARENKRSAARAAQARAAAVEKYADYTPAERAAAKTIGDKPDLVPIREYHRRVLNDPYSVRYGDAYGPLLATCQDKKPCWSIRLNYRAKNAFGAYINQSQVYFIRSGQVVDVMD
jgi:hypothetical protein